MRKRIWPRIDWMQKALSKFITRGKQLADIFTMLVTSQRIECISQHSRIKIKTGAKMCFANLFLNDNDKIY